MNTQESTVVHIMYEETGLGPASDLTKVTKLAGNKAQV